MSPSSASRRIRKHLPQASTRALVALGLLAATTASAHEYWLAPSRYAAAAGDTVTVAAFVGTGFRGERKPYASPRAVRLEARGLKVRDLRSSAVNGDPDYGWLVAQDAKGILVSYQSTFVPIELPAPEFDHYLRLEGLEGPLRERARSATPKPGRERYARCPKTWIAGSDPKRLLTPSKLPFEIVPLDDPERGTSVRLRVLYQGRPLEGALVRAWNHPLDHGAFPRDAASRDSVGPSAEARTARDGIATLSMAAAGEWLVSCVLMVPSSDRKVADWESWWASLTFARGVRRP